MFSCHAKEVEKTAKAFLIIFYLKLKRINGKRNLYNNANN